MNNSVKVNSMATTFSDLTTNRTKSKNTTKEHNEDEVLSSTSCTNHRNKYNFTKLNKIFERTNSFKPSLPPPNPLIQRTKVPVVTPKFANMKTYISLPEFITNEEKLILQYKTLAPPKIQNNSLINNIVEQNNINQEGNNEESNNNGNVIINTNNDDDQSPRNNNNSIIILNNKNQEEKLIQISAYINSSIMLSKLVYLKTKFKKDKTISLNNIVNIRKIDSTEPSTSFSEKKSIDDSSSSNFIHHNNYIDNSDEIKPYYTLKDKNDTTLLFESRFESGNLLCAFRVDDENKQNNYQLFLQNDTNTTGYIQWFFFRVRNGKKGQRVTINIMNLMRKKCLYRHGLKVIGYSVKRAENEKIGFYRCGENIIYYQNNLFVYNRDKRRSLYTLSFEYEFLYDNDTVFFANCQPYLYRDVMNELDYYQLNEVKYPFFHRKTLCTTLGGNNLDMFSINYRIPGMVVGTRTQYEYYPSEDKRKAVVLIARVHPGECVSSYVMKGAIDFLMGDSDEAKKMRELYIFKIIPMLNPDGVLSGNSRTSYAGCDLNRRWEEPNDIMHPEVFHAKELILSLANQRDIAFVCDFHGHIGAFNSFFYCNHKENYRSCSLFPYICSKVCKIISYNQTNFKMPRYKRSTCRISLFHQLNLNNIVTLETSFFGTNKVNNNGREYYTTEIIKSIGRDICLGMLAYFYKYENKIIEKKFIEHTKQLDVDMNEYEKQVEEEEKIKIIDDDKDDNEEENSESEPSIDNFDKDKIMKLMPFKTKKKRNKTKPNIRKKFKVHSLKKCYKMDLSVSENKPERKTSTNLNNNIINNNNNNKLDKLKDNNTKAKSISKIAINCNFNNVKKIPIPKNEIKTYENRKDQGTQTEEIFFKMHWTYFVGEYTIISYKESNINLNRFNSSIGYRFKPACNKSYNCNININRDKIVIQPRFKNYQSYNNNNHLNASYFMHSKNRSSFDVKNFINNSSNSKNHYPQNFNRNLGNTPFNCYNSNLNRNNFFGKILRNSFIFNQNKLLYQKPRPFSKSNVIN